MSSLVSTNSVSPGFNLPVGPYRWQVRAIGRQADRSSFSPRQDIWIGGRPILFGPAGTFANPVLFSWSNVEGAARYRFQVDRIDVPQKRVIYRDDLAGTTHSLATPLASGIYHFWVQALTVSDAFGPWSVPMDFRIET